MTIAVYDMHSKDYVAQIVFWKNLNSILARHGVFHPKFKGFIADSAQTNSNVLKTIYESSDIHIPMENQERTCLFYWTQSMEKHTKVDIRLDLQDQHHLLCKQYKIVVSSKESETQYLAIKAWWLSSSAMTEEGLH